MDGREWSPATEAIDGNEASFMEIGNPEYASINSVENCALVKANPNRLRDCQESVIRVHKLRVSLNNVLPCTNQAKDAYYGVEKSVSQLRKFKLKSRHQPW